MKVSEREEEIGGGKPKLKGSILSHKTGGERKSGHGSKSIKVFYSNIDGLISKKLELGDYIREMKPEVICLTETKIDKDVVLEVLGWNNYNIWRKDREGKVGGGVLIMTHVKLKARNINIVTGTGNNRAEILAVEIEGEDNNNIDIVVVYMPPQTRAWRYEEYELLKKETADALRQLLQRRNRLLLTGDFNCKEVDWECMDAGNNASSWGNILLEIITDNFLTQHIKEHTRVRGEDEPSRLDLTFTKDPNDVQNLKYLCPIGKSDHLVIEMEFLVCCSSDYKEEHKEHRYNYSKADFESLRQHFERVDWRVIEESRSIQEKYSIFVDIYKDAIAKHVPKFKVRPRKDKEWFNNRCQEALTRRNVAWNRARRKPSNHAQKKYKDARNEYVKIRREEEAKYEKNIVNKCEKEPKLFYKFINGKMKIKDRLTKLKVEENTYEDEASMCEVMIDKLQSVFVEEEAFVEPEDVQDVNDKLTGVEFEPIELLELMKGLEVRKAMGPDEISGWILRECAEQLIRPIYEIIQYSLGVGDIPLEWKRANIVPIYKSGDREDPLNYRPVSLTSIISKLCEKIIRRRWVKYLEEWGIITAKQFGFREGSSCVTNLLSFYDRVIDIMQERDGWVDCVYLDLKKSF